MNRVPSPAARPPIDWRAVLAVGIVIVVGASVTSIALARSPAGPSRPVSMTNETALLGSVFHPGIILSGDSNATTTLLGGIGVYAKQTDFSLPVLAAIDWSSGTPTLTNLTPEISDYFWNGGIYSIVWNGSAWLLTGQAAWGGVNSGAVVSWQGGHWVNLTAPFRAATIGGGIWAAAWNGTAWLLGGNGTADGPVLFSLTGRSVTNLSRAVTWHGTRSWYQFLAWGGHDWLIAGEGILGVLRGSTFTDVFPASPYAGSGVYAGSWTGKAWLVGGGAGRSGWIEGTTFVPGPTLPSEFNQAILWVHAVPGGWLFAGKGGTAATPFEPVAAFWTGAPGNGSMTDLTGLLPTAFEGGEVYGGVMLPPSAGPLRYALYGEGGYNSTTGHGVGALAGVTVESSAGGTVRIAEGGPIAAQHTNALVWAISVGSPFVQGLGREEGRA